MSKAVPAALFMLGAAAGTGGGLLGTAGVRDQFDARKREDAAERVFRDRMALSESRRRATDERLAAWAQLRQASEADVVERMRAFMRRHARQVRENVLLDSSVDLAVTAMPAPPVDEANAGGWVTGVLGTVAAGTATATVMSEGAEQYGSASTGTPLSELHGAAKDRATKAFFGGGSIDSGGGGMDVGDSARNTAIVGIAVLAAGAATKVSGTRAQTRAKRYEVARALDRANLDLEDVHLEAVDERADEVSQVLKKLRKRALAALDELESVTFDSIQHLALFHRTLTLVKAVQDAAAAQLISEDGTLTEGSATLSAKHRPTATEDNDA